MMLTVWNDIARSDYAAPICGMIALACVIAWPYAASHRRAVAVQSLGAAAFVVQFACLGAWTAAAASLLCLAQLLCVASTADRGLLRMVGGASIVALVAIMVATWEGTPSLLAVCGSMAGSLARFQRSTTRMKVIFLIGAPFWLLHNVAVGAVFALCVDVVSIVGNIASLARTAKRSERNLFDPFWLMDWAFELPPSADTMRATIKPFRVGYA